MSGFETAGSFENLSAPAHVAAAVRPRISADAFRNLTARLKKPELVVPDLSPVLPAVSVVVPALAPVALAPAPVVPDVAPAIVEVPEVVMPVHVEATPAPAIAPIEIAPVSVEAFAPLPEFDISPELPEPLISVSPVVEVVSVEEPVPSPIEAELTIEPFALPAQIEIAPEEAPEQKWAFPPLPEFMPAAIEQAPATADPVPMSISALEGGFSENFTYVPEAGKSNEFKLDPAEVEEAIKREVAERATELELENIWRMLLAKPTAEDRLHYLKEAAEYHATDEEWNKPAPEHDLSQIVPAAVVEETPGQSLNVASAFQDGTRSLEDKLQVASGQDLAELTRSLLDMMAAGNSAGLPQERALAADTLLRLVPRLELKPVILLAQRLAIMDNPPHLLVSRLIRDTRVEVAGPLLEDCPHITDKDLEMVVLEGEQDKLRTIARRRKLTRAISDALIKSGDSSVVLTLVRNMEAEISHDGFLSLLVLCENNPDLLAPLATRQDLGAPFAFELFWLAPAQLRRFILTRFLTDSETLSKILKITLATAVDEESPSEPMNQHTLLEALERASRGQTEIAAEEIATLMQISAATVTRILGDVEGEPLVVMLKAAGYPRSAMAGLLKRMQDAELPLVARTREVGDLQAMFETLSFNKARILLTYWDWAQSKSGPYAPMH